MRTHLTRLGAAAAAAAVALTLSACSAQDETVVAFCDAFDSLEALTGQPQDADDDDPAAAAAARLETVTVEMEGIDPPAEIDASFTLVTEHFRALSDATAKSLAVPDDEAEQTAVAEASQRMTTAEFTDATAELDAFTEEHCS
ncbi:hypothetical protein ATJ88_2757 [Isoptericola jiangsuensis]|uniref:Lipoprotein n=1 Tax=Isoptericola jiangsuensis TaxID=548579 RepID=A0A2A9F0K8_9MICO|nr:hypothetical protein [Isoptericola jiangsuensis]PFG44040.1 hypothetical protein ATJ88_2757 [Isoptericola jiangsuensis]